MRKAVRVCVPGYGHWWLWLVTYPTREALKAACEQHFGSTLPDMFTDDHYGVEGTFTDNLPGKSPYLGIMRLYNTDFQCIVHESVHAAMCMAKKFHGESRTVSHTKEEAVAYGTEFIAAAVSRVLNPEEFDD